MVIDSRPCLYDVNALVALCLSTHVHHGPAHRHLARLRVTWQTTPITEAGLSRLLLNPAVTGRRLAAHEVTDVLAGLRDDPRWAFLPDASSFVEARVDTTVLAGHQQVTDLHLVNLAARAGARLATFDASLTSWLAPADRAHVELIDHR